MPRSLLCMLLCFVFVNSQAGVYTYIDSEGNRVFTDKPQSEHAERIELAAPNGMPAGKPTAPLVIPPAIPRELSYQVLRILIPEPDSTIRDMAGNMIITATSEPGLHPGHGFRLVMDGKPMGTPGASPVFSLENIDRGTHQISVEIVDPQGRIIERTPAQPFHMKRISLAEKRRANPCMKKDWGVRPECPLKDKPKDPPKDIPLIPFI